MECSKNAGERFPKVEKTLTKTGETDINDIVIVSTRKLVAWCYILGGKY